MWFVVGRYPLLRSTKRNMVMTVTMSMITMTAGWGKWKAISRKTTTNKAINEKREAKASLVGGCRCFTDIS